MAFEAWHGMMDSWSCLGCLDKNVMMVAKGPSWFVAMKSVELVPQYLAPFSARH